MSYTIKNNCLDFNDDFNQSIINVNLPLNLESIIFGVAFNQPLINSNLPHNLQSITFGHRFNQDLPNSTLPPNLKSISFGNLFNNKIFLNNELPSIELIKFGSNFNQDLDLPRSLKKITFGKNYYRPVSFKDLDNLELIITYSEYKMNYTPMPKSLKKIIKIKQTIIDTELEYKIYEKKIYLYKNDKLRSEEAFALAKEYEEENDLDNAYKYYLKSYKLGNPEAESYLRK